MNYKRMLHAPAWVVSEIIWYFKWWFNLFHLIGVTIISIGVKLIEFHDFFWDEVDRKIQNMREGDVLD